MPKVSKNRKAWKLFRVEDFVSLTSSYMYIVMLFGLVPCKIESSRYIFKRKRFIWGIVVAIIYAWCAIRSCYNANYKKTYKEASGILYFNVRLLISAPTLLTSYARSRKILRALQRVSDISRMVPPQMFRQAAKMIFIRDAIHLITLLVHVPDIIMAKSISQNTVWFTFLTMLLLDKLLINSLQVLNMCFEIMNESLTDLKEMLINDQPHLLRRIYHARRNPVLLRELRSFRKRYMEVSKVFQALCDTFSPHVAGYLLLLISDITFNMYTLIEAINNRVSWKEWILKPLFITHFITNLIYLVYICECLKKQDQNFATKIHRIFITTFDEELSEEVKQNEEGAIFGY